MNSTFDINKSDCKLFFLGCVCKCKCNNGRYNKVKCTDYYKIRNYFTLSSYKIYCSFSVV